MTLREEIQKRFEAMYQRKQIPWLRAEVPMAVVTFADRAAGAFPGGKLLDLGCGNGWLANYLAGRGFVVEGIDSAPTAIREAEALAHPDTRFTCGDALDLPYEDSSFDIVFDRGLLHHVPVDLWGQYEHEVARVLKPGGLFYLSVFSAHSNKDGHAHEGERGHEKTDPSGFRSYDHYFDPATFGHIFGSSFEEIASEEEVRESADGSLMLSLTMQKRT